MLIVICGPTATGKSSLAMWLAQKLKTDIISADSRQVYREFDIGTAKPTLCDRERVRHHLIDTCEPTETLTLADYQQQVQHIIHTHQQQRPHKPILLVGGTGLYIKSITHGLLIPQVPPQSDLRSQLFALDQPQLHAQLAQVDPISAQKIHIRDRTRTVRALEVFYVTGRPISEQQGECPPDYPILQIGLNTSPENLAENIAQRTEAMLQAGLVTEVQGLLTKYGAELSLLSTLGYAEIRDHLLRDRTLTEAQDAIIQHTRQFAKRQRTWFRRISGIYWLDSRATDLKESADHLIRDWHLSIEIA